jgi:hypothetical protein
MGAKTHIAYQRTSRAKSLICHAVHLRPRTEKTCALLVRDRALRAWRLRRRSPATQCIAWDKFVRGWRPNVLAAAIVSSALNCEKRTG